MKVKPNSDVLIVGAGPVGLLAGLCLARRGVSVQVIDREQREYVHGYSLVLHPHTLRLLDEHGLARSVLAQGQRIDRLTFFDQGERAGAAEFGALAGAYPCALVLPQSRLETTLRKALEAQKVRVLGNHEAMHIEAAAEHVTVTVGRLDKVSLGYPIARSEWIVEKEFETTASFVIGADGPNSFVRGAIGSEYEKHGPTQAYAVFELPYAMRPNDEGQVIFKDQTTNAIWPINSQRVRWVFETDAQGGDHDLDLDLAACKRLAAERAPWQAQAVTDMHWATKVRFGRRLASRFGRGRIWLAGDAAHITSPIGAQSLNAGLREAHDLAECVAAAIHKGKGGQTDLLEQYDASRRQAWSRMLGIGARTRPLPGAAAWAEKRAEQLAVCIPASGDDLDSLLAQLKLERA